MDFLNSFRKTKGYLMHDADACSYCGICHKCCPHKAIKVDSQKKIWKLRMICMKCGFCLDKCPKGALSLQKSDQ